MTEDREKTNIEVYQETWRRLNLLKESPGDSFDDVINRLIDEQEEPEKGG
jgi:predicted CopG family antitoxin